MAISIKELVNLIVKFTLLKGDILWIKPDGQSRRRLNVNKVWD